MATYVLIHGAGDVGWYWHLVERELRRRGHETLAPDLPCYDDAASLDEYTDAVVGAIGGRTDLVLVGTSFGGYTAALVADRLPARGLVFVTGMVPAPGEPAEDWFTNTGWERAVHEQGVRDGGLTGNEDPFVIFYNDVPRALAEEALRRERPQSDTPGRNPWATRCLALRSDAICPLYRGPILPARLHAPRGTGADRHHTGRDPGRTLCRAEPSEGAR